MSNVGSTSHWQLLRLSHAMAMAVLVASTFMSSPLLGQLISRDQIGTPIAVYKSVATFVENQGQWDGDFAYKTHVGGMSVFVSDNGWTVALGGSGTPARPEQISARDHAAHRSSANDDRLVAIRMSFGGSARAASITPEGRHPGVHNYILGTDHRRWKSGVPLYEALLLGNVWPGIDIRTRFEGDHFEYDVILEPGADLAQVSISVEGSDGLRVDPSGALIIATPLGLVTQSAPRTWQVGPQGRREPVKCTYTLTANGRFGFRAPDWDRSLPLVIDPGLVYSTFVGGSLGEECKAVAVQPNGAATFVGWTYSVNFPTSVGAYSNGLIGNGRDVFVSRLNPSGTALEYSTFVGGSGSGDDEPFGLALDALGAATVVGLARSLDFPTTPGAFDVSHNNLNHTSGTDNDAFIFRLSPTGNALQFSTFLGGSGDDWATSVALDATGAATIVGHTSSNNFPATAGSLDQTNNGGGDDAFVARLNLTGTALVYSTFLGGTNYDFANAVTIDVATGESIVAGHTSSANFPTTSGAFDTVFNGGGDAFVARLNAGGTALVYSTYVGGSNWEQVRTVAVDSTGSVTAAGHTASTNFPTTIGAFDTTYNGGQDDAFVLRLNPTATGLVFSSLLGGSQFDVINSVALGSDGTTLVVGSTRSMDFPVTSDAYMPTFAGGSSDDAFVASVSPTGDAIRYSTFLGGSLDDYAYSVALDPSGVATIVGSTRSLSFPSTFGSFDATHNGQTDAFVVRVPVCSAVPSAGSPQGMNGPSTVTWEVGAGGNGHRYETVVSPSACGVTWSQAHEAATAAGGHLVTIESSAENAFVFSLINAPVYWSNTPTEFDGPWIGGMQPLGSPEPSGGWRWVTSEPFQQTAWDFMKPSNSCSSSDNRINFHWTKAVSPTPTVPRWGDLNGDGCGNRRPKAYVIEYEPTLNCSAPPSGLFLCATSDAAGFARLQIFNAPANTIYGKTLVSTVPAFPVGTGSFFGLQPDLLTLSILVAPSSAGDPTTWIYGEEGRFPRAPFYFPPSVTIPFTGMTWDFVAVVVTADAAIHFSNFVQKTW